MAQTVREIMNPELFSLKACDGADAALRYLSTLDISGAPVLDAEGRPVGMISFRDLVGTRRNGNVASRMSSPVACVGPHTSIREAARHLGEAGFHRLVVVDDDGHAIGIVSSLDLMRALAGLPASHPATFPHFDTATGLTWSDDTTFDVAHLERAPEAPGILMLRVGGAGETETDVWVEPSPNVRTRLREILCQPQTDRRLTLLLQRYGRRLRYRAAATSGRPRDAALAVMHEREDQWVWARSP